MKILRLEAENLKRLEAVEITPDGHVVKITGKNGHGKTSTLDAIWMALGGADAIPDKPIREGQDKARVTLDLGDLVVERRFTQKGTQLYVSNKDGARYGSPQRMLDDLVGRLTFDPLQFMRQDPKKQAETLRDLAGLDFSDLDEARENAYNDRRDINREIRDLEGQLNEITVPEDAPREEVDVSELAEQLNAANAEQTALREKQHTLDQRRHALEETQQLVEQLRQELEDAEVAAGRLSGEVDSLQQEIADTTVTDSTPILERMNNAKALNEAYRLRKQAESLRQRLEGRRAASRDLTGEISNADQQKQERIREAELPVDGLGFDEDGHVTYQGIPLQQASSAEQLRVSVAMAMAINPKLRVLRITDGSLLDSDSLRVIEDMAADGDYQVWMECVDETGKVGVVIEDGRVKAKSAATAE